LANVIERAQILAEGDTITCDDLPDNIAGIAPAEPMPAAASVPVSTTPPAAPPADSTRLRDLDRPPVHKLLGLHNGNKVHAAKALGVSRRALYRLIDKHKLDAPPDAASGTP